MLTCLSLAWVISYSGRQAQVNAFSSDLPAINSVPIVDAAILYECPYTHVKYILVARNVLYILTLDHHLVAPFILREAGLIVDDIPKSQSQVKTIENHSIYSRENYL